MSTERAKAFANALNAYEQDGDLEKFLQQFSDDCEVCSVATPHALHGQQGARQFWRSYRSVLSNVRSEFRNLIESDGRVALEWKTEGTASTGEPIHYEGTSVLEFEGEKVKRFFAYFDPHRLGLEITGGSGRLPRTARQPLTDQPAVEGP